LIPCRFNVVQGCLIVAHHSASKVRDEPSSEDHRLAYVAGRG
jgi:hypothetical protein